MNLPLNGNQGRHDSTDKLLDVLAIHRKEDGTNSRQIEALELDGFRIILIDDRLHMVEQEVNDLVAVRVEIGLTEALGNMDLPLKEVLCS